MVDSANSAVDQPHAPSTQGGTARDCIDDNTIVAMLEGRLAGAALAALEGHVDRCRACRSLVADLADQTHSVRLEKSRTMLLGGNTQVLVKPETLGWLKQLGRCDTHYEPGQRIDHFEILREVGRGGMGEIYLARDTKLGRRVALKVVSRRQLEEGGDPQGALEQFMREARTTALLSHPNIVTIHAVGEHEGRPYLALEYIKGKTLREYLDDHPARTLRESLHIGLSVADALVAAHGHGVLHRDLKPENVLIGRDRRVRVVDFGLAETIENDMGETTHRERPREVGPIVAGIVGTPRYMAPEQWEDEERSGATDVWALGLILYELIADEHPYEEATTIQEVAAAVCSDDPVPALPIAEDTAVEAELKGLVARMVAKTHGQRPDAGTVAETLRRLHDALGIVVTRAPSRASAMLWGGFGIAAVVAGGALAFTVLQPAKTAKAPSDSAEPAARPTATVSASPTGSPLATTSPRPSSSAVAERPASETAPEPSRPRASPPSGPRPAPDQPGSTEVRPSPSPEVEPSPVADPQPKDPLDVF